MIDKPTLPANGIGKHESRIDGLGRGEADGNFPRLPHVAPRPSASPLRPHNMMFDMPELPSKWEWSNLANICEPPQYGWTTSAAMQGKVKLLRTTDITSGIINWSSVPYCTEAPENIEKYLLNDGDIVISRAGSVGFSILIKKPKPAVFASYLIRFRPKKSLVDEKYLAYYLQSPFYWQSISESS